MFALEGLGSDEDFMVEDGDVSDYGHSKKRGKKTEHPCECQDLRFSSRIW